MLPRWHILFGGIFSLILWIAAPKTKVIFILLIFFCSFLMDFDHYLCSVCKTKRFSLFHAFEYHKEIGKIQIKERNRGIKQRGDFHIFHTIEFHIFIGLLGFVWVGFFYAFLGMIFHSLLDVYSLLYDKLMYRREFFLTRWLWRRIIKPQNNFDNINKRKKPNNLNF